MMANRTRRRIARRVVGCVLAITSVAAAQPQNHQLRHAQPGESQPQDARRPYDVVIAGGSTAALAAAFAAAEEGARVALLEPTDWIGGQLTSSAVPAIDEAWHKIKSSDGHVLLDVAAIARDPRNVTPFFRDSLTEIGNPGGGWVSRYCFEPRELLDSYLEPRERELSDRLTVYRETVVKKS